MYSPAQQAVSLQDPVSVARVDDEHNHYFYNHLRTTYEASLEATGAQPLDEPWPRMHGKCAQSLVILPTADGQVYGEAEEVVERGPGRSRSHVDPQAHQS